MVPFPPPVLSNIEYFLLSTAISVSVPHPVAADWVLPRSRALDFEMATAVATVQSFAALPENWDGYGAVRIGSTAVDNANNALQLLLPRAPAPDISPNPSGTISFEWETEEGVAYMEIGATRFSVFIEPKAGGTTHINGMATQLDRQVGSLIASILFPAGNNGSTFAQGVLVPSSLLPIT